MTRRRKRIILAALGGLGLALLAAAAFRLPLAEAGLTALLEDSGFTQPRLTVTRLDWQGLEIADLAVGGDALTVGQIRVSYGVSYLLLARLRQVEIQHARIGITLGADGISIDGLPPAEPSDEAAAPLSLPVDTLLLRDIRVAAATPAGTIDAMIEGRAESARGVPGLTANLAYIAESGHGAAAGGLSAKVQDARNLEATLTVDRGDLAAPFATAKGLNGYADILLRQGRVAAASLELAAAGAATDTTGSNLSGSFTATGIYEPGQAQLNLNLAEADSAARVELDMTIDRPLTAPSWQLDGQVALSPATALWASLGLPAPTAGHARLTLHSDGTPATAAAAKLPESLAEALSAITGTLTAQLDLDGVDHPGIGRGLDGEMAATLAVADGRATLNLPGEARLSLDAISPALFDPAGLPTEWRPKRVGPLQLRLHGAGSNAPRAVLRRDGGGLRLDAAALATVTAGGGSMLRADLAGEAGLDDGGRLLDFRLTGVDVMLRSWRLPALSDATMHATGDLTGEADRLGGAIELRFDATGLALADASAQAVSARLPLSLSVTPQAATVQLRAPGSLSVQDAAIADTARLPGTLALSLQAAEAPLLALTRDGAAPDLAHAMRLQGEKIDIALQRSGAGALLIRLQSPDIAIAARQPAGQDASAAIAADLAALILPVHGLRFEDLHSDITMRDSGRRMKLTVSAPRIRDEGPAPLFAPVAAQASAELANDDLSIVAGLHDSAGTRRVAAEGRYRLSTGIGAADIRLLPLSFSPGGLQPGALVPPLAALERVVGKLQADVALSIQPGGLDGTGRVDVESLGFTLGGIDIAGLNTALSLNGLAPPASAPAQRLTVASIDSITPLTDLELTYHLRPGSAGGELPQLVIEQARTQILGGTVSTDDLAIDAGNGRIAGTLAVRNLDLQRLLALIDAEGIDGEGQLSGDLPIVIANGAVSVSAGRLANDSGGVLRVRSQQVAQAIGQGNEDLTLVARVLEDFRYETLSMQIDKAVQGDGHVALSMLGHNPAVLDGHPFQFNINVTSNVDELLAALAQAYGSATGTLNRALENIR